MAIDQLLPLVLSQGLGVAMAVYFGVALVYELKACRKASSDADRRLREHLEHDHGAA